MNRLARQRQGTSGGSPNRPHLTAEALDSGDVRLSIRCGAVNVAFSMAPADARIFARGVDALAYPRPNHNGYCPETTEAETDAAPDARDGPCYS